MKMHLYCRVSSDRQVDEGALENQKVWARQLWKSLLASPKWAECLPGEPLDDPGVSAASVPLFERPAGARLNALVVRGDAVLFANGDRGWRNNLDWENTLASFRRRGVKIIMADMPDVDPEQPAGKFACGVRILAAEFESSERAAKVRAGMRVCKERNQKLGRHERRPGWRLTRCHYGPERKVKHIYVPDPDQFRLLAKIHELRARGAAWVAIGREVVAMTGDRWWTGRNCHWAHALSAIREGQVELVTCRSRDELLQADPQRKRRQRAALAV